MSMAVAQHAGAPAPKRLARSLHPPRRSGHRSWDGTEVTNRGIAALISVMGLRALPGPSEPGLPTCESDRERTHGHEAPAARPAGATPKPSGHQSWDVVMVAIHGFWLPCRADRA